jgi:hypothetical protein
VHIMRTSRSISLDDLGVQLSIAKERLSLEKQDILKQDLLPKGLNREEYIFAYMRAERMGMSAINARLTEIAWLPMQLDPKSELVAENRSSMKRWLTAVGTTYPGATEFGNDFIHALARSALGHGWEDSSTKKLMKRIGTLFRDLSCLIGIIYFTTWLAEHDVEGIALSDPEDLHRSVIEIAAIVQSPELHKALRERAELMRKEKAKKSLEKKRADQRPLLRLIRNDDFDVDGFMPDPLPV